MKELEINCYFCGNKATQEEEYDTSRNVRVKCPNCTYYELTSGAIKFYIIREDGKEVLSQNHKYKLSEDVKKTYQPEKNQPVRIDTDKIKLVQSIIEGETAELRDCIFCGRLAVVRPVSGKDEFSVECPHGKYYSNDLFEEEVKANKSPEEKEMISAYIQECNKLGENPPKLHILDESGELARKIEKYRK